MSAYSCAQLRDVAPELALGVLGGAERAEAIMHVNGCARCQALVNELTEVADALPLLAPEIEPPSGFEQTRALVGTGAPASQRRGGGWRRSRSPRRRPRSSASPSSASSSPGSDAAAPTATATRREARGW